MHITEDPVLRKVLLTQVENQKGSEGLGREKSVVGRTACCKAFLCNVNKVSPVLEAGQCACSTQSHVFHSAGQRWEESMCVHGGGRGCADHTSPYKEICLYLRKMGSHEKNLGRLTGSHLRL